ncbi:MAG: penicillin-binding protein 1A [Alphaproteobacteria bacterium]|nr:penicillin-binding protein 1A [Alphaproteobacteria bacterium]
MRTLVSLVTLALTAGLLVFAVAVVGGFWVFYTYGQGLPEYRQLEAYRPPVVTRLYAADGRLLAEYAQEKRIFVPVEAIPPMVRRAFLSAEDKSFYAHYGVDPFAIARAAMTNLRNAGDERRLVGASTITQQVAKNFLLSNEVSYERKIREAILALRLERALSKDRILELYLNEIYLGRGSYGVAAAALDYFGKPLRDLDLGEAAFLAALPKAPNNYNPVRSPAAAKGRRDWVLSRMEEDGVISSEAALEAQDSPLLLTPRGGSDVTSAEFFAEEVRRELASRYGEGALYGGGLLVRTTLDPRLQEIAERALRDRLMEYDRRHGWRGALRRGVTAASWGRVLELYEPPAGAEHWTAARVLVVDDGGLVFEDANRRTGRIYADDLAWALPPRTERGPVAGDMILIDREWRDADASADSDGDSAGIGERVYVLRQVPRVNGALVALDPHSGRVMAMVGGFSQRASEFNRATQALRQTGSAFKPFVYLSALEEGITPTETILDAPFVSDQGPGLEKWKPGNYSGEYYGPTPMRVGVERSRNLMTVRLAARVGMDKVADVARRLDLFDELPPYLSYALGAGEVTLLSLTAAYGELVNGGRDITPTMIDKIQDRYGATLYRGDARVCGRCSESEWHGQEPPALAEGRGVVTDPASAYQITSILEGVVQRGTGRRALSLGRPLGGKTGTSNDFVDAWFVGFSPDLVAGVYVGFDEPRSLGSGESGARAALPVWQQFMSEALEGELPVPFRVPSAVRLRWVIAETGEGAVAGDAGAILEAFKPGQGPVRVGVRGNGVGDLY